MSGVRVSASIMGTRRYRSFIFLHFLHNLLKPKLH